MRGIQIAFALLIKGVGNDMIRLSLQPLVAFITGNSTKKGCKSRVHRDRQPIACDSNPCFGAYDFSRAPAATTSAAFTLATAATASLLALFASVAISSALFTASSAFCTSD